MPGTRPKGRRELPAATVLTGPPVAAIVATLVGGLLADVSWRMAWVAVPFAASVFAVVAIRTRPPEPPIPRTSGDLRSLWRVSGVPGWAAGELLSYSAWSGIPVYAGALLIGSYGVSPTIAAGAIGASAAAFVAGNLSARRWVDGSARSLLLVLSLMLATAAAAFGMLRPGLWLSITLLVVLGGLAGGRTLAGSAFGLRAVRDRGVAVMGVRTTAQQCGYVFGTGLGGAAIAAGGYAALGALLSSLFLLAALPHGLAVRRGTAARPAKLRHGLGAVPDVMPTASRSASLP
jgi:predicted MFS family arabinose efflux permease